MRGRWCARFLRPIVPQNGDNISYIEVFMVLAASEVCKARREALKRIDEFGREDELEKKKNPQLRSADVSGKNLKVFFRAFPDTLTA